MTRHFLADDSLSPDEQTAVLELAARMKEDRYYYHPLAGPQSVAVLFDKPSTRTRVSFSVGVAELGGYPLVIDAATSQLGRGEPIADTARSILDGHVVLDRKLAVAGHFPSIDPLASFIATMGAIFESRSTVSGSMSRPVLDGMLYRTMGRSVASAILAKWAYSPSCVGRL